MRQMFFRDQPGNVMSLCQCSIKKDAIVQEVFRANEMLRELYKLAKKTVTMALANFNEFIVADKDAKLQCYFQPRYLLGGRSFCSLEYDTYNESTERLEYALNHVPDIGGSSSGGHNVLDAHFLANSLLHEMALPQRPQERELAGVMLQQIGKALDLNPYYDLQTDFLSAESIIQRGLDTNTIKPVLVLTDFLFSQQRKKELQEVFLQDLPQLLCQNKNKVDMLKFYNVIHDEFLVSIADAGEQSQTSLVCNLENYFHSPELPFLGSGQTRHELLKVDNLFNIVYEAEQAIIESHERWSEGLDQDAQVQAAI